MSTRTLFFLGLLAATLSAHAGDTIAPPVGTQFVVSAVRDGESTTYTNKLAEVDGLALRWLRNDETETRSIIPFCWACTAYRPDSRENVIDEDEYRKLFPLEVGNKVSFTRWRPDRSRSWEHVIEVVGKETVTVPVGQFEALKVVESVKGVASEWWAERTYWYAPEVGYYVKGDLKQGGWDGVRWKHITFETTKVIPPN